MGGPLMRCWSISFEKNCQQNIELDIQNDHNYVTSQFKSDLNYVTYLSELR